MKALTLEEATTAMQGHCDRLAPGGSFARVVTDSREVRPGDLFIAIKGERFDGHEFLPQALAAGAVAAVVRSDYIPPDGPASGVVASDGMLIRVDDTIQALGRLGRYYRRQIIGGSMTVIAVTGSNGKTTTKFMIAHILGGRWKGHASVKSFNNNIGVPLTLLSAEPPETFLVCELGMNAPGEIGGLAHLVEPDIAVVTSVAEAHLERLGSIERIAEEKLSLLSHLQADGLAVVNVDREVVRRFLEKDRRFRKIKRVTAGEWQEADLRLTDARKVEAPGSRSQDGADERPAGGPDGAPSGSRLEEGPREGAVPCWEFTVNDRFAYRLCVPGRHNVVNALCAIAVARRMGMDHDEIAARLATFELPRMRLECEQIGEIRVINDAYNANPASLAAAISVLADMPAAGRRVLVVGDMRELGAAAQTLHRQCAGQIAAARLDLVIAVGEHAETIAAEVSRSSGGRTATVAYATTAAARRRLVSHLEAGDTLLLKGSRAMGLEVLLDDIRASALASARQQPSCTAA